MINLKRNSKGELVDAKGLRSRESSIYSPNQTEDFKISRSKFTDFLLCKKCFYLDRVKGLASPGMPGWSLNETTDILLKKEFDKCREEKVPHRIMKEYKLDHVVPFQHEEMDNWRNSLHHGLKVKFKDSNIILQGGIDDLWQDTKEDKLILVDYKSQASLKKVFTEEYLQGIYHQGYKIQMDFYAYLLQEMGFQVLDTSYFYVCNADRAAPDFGGVMRFEETLVPYQWNSNWIESEVEGMISTLNSTKTPESNTSCENCAYARERSKQ